MELFEKDYKLEKEIDHVESGSSFEMAEDLDVLEVNTSQDNDKLAEAREMLLGLYARKAEVSKRMSESDYEWSDDSLGMQFRDAVANEPLSRDELIETFRLIEEMKLEYEKTGNETFLKLHESLKEKVLMSSLRLTYNLAKKVIHESSATRADINQMGVQGLMSAIDKYDYQTGYALGTLASYWIHQRVSRDSREQTGVVRLPEHAHLDWLKLKKELENDRDRDKPTKKLEWNAKKTSDILSAGNVLHGVENEILKSKDSGGSEWFDREISDNDEWGEMEAGLVVEALIKSAKLTEHEEISIRGKYGLNDEGVEYSLGEIARLYNFDVGVGRVQQYQKSAIFKLQIAIIKQGLNYQDLS